MYTHLMYCIFTQPVLASPLTCYLNLLICFRQQQKDEHGRQLTDELEEIRKKTGLEIEQIRIQTRNMFERENKVLQEAKERSDNDRDKIEDKLKEVEEKYDLLMTE